MEGRNWLRGTSRWTSIFEKMGLILYRCPEDLPDRIPEVLLGMQFPATCEFRPKHDGDDRGFRYEAERGRGRISILGGLEDGDIVCSIVFGSLNPLGWRASEELLKDATEALLQAGMKEITVEELEELEARRSRENEKHSS